MPDYDHKSAMEEIRSRKASESKYTITENSLPPEGRKAVIFTDGSCPANPGPMGIGILILEDGAGTAGIEFGYTLGEGTNNHAEYLALIHAMRYLLKNGFTHVHFNLDSLLIVNHLAGKWKVKDFVLKRYHSEALSLIEMFSTCTMSHVPREKNEVADYLSKHPTDDAILPSDPEGVVINVRGKVGRKLSRRQAAMIQWWWKTGRCTSEHRLARIFDVAPSVAGKIGRGERYKDLGIFDLPGAV
jgi:ribonuclease HI